MFKNNPQVTAGSSHKEPVTENMFPFDYVIIIDKSISYSVSHPIGKYLCFFFSTDHEISNMSCNLVGSNMAYHSDVVGA